jgi:hypothetical protein
MFGGAAAGASWNPQSGQNRNPGEMDAPQLGHAWTTRVPQAWQNALPAISSVPQLLQRMAKLSSRTTGQSSRSAGGGCDGC